MRRITDILQQRPPYINTVNDDGELSTVDYAFAKERLGLDEDLEYLRSRMNQRDQLKSDVILETALERLEHRKDEQDWIRPGRVDAETEEISERLAKDGLSAEPDAIRKEAESNVAKHEQHELAVITRETQVQLERHHDQALGPHRERTRTARR